ncbi:MAG: endonuclease/exonuclease/phosphatase family protein [Flavobacteriales bacterium]|nr:endonuclease/exonuclease/phosphatase family protein [Flavobacteriales bacterium]
MTITAMRALLFLLLLIALQGARAQTITVVCWNIRYDNPGDSLDGWELRRDALAQEVRRQHPQLIGLQEVLVHQAEYLDAQWPGYRRFGVGREDGAARGEFSPIYYDTTAIRLISGRTIWLSPTPGIPSKGWDAECERIATYAVLYDLRTSDSVHVVNTHWDHEGAEARIHSARMLLEILGPALQRGGHTVLMGDFNATAEQLPIRALDDIFTDSAPKQNRGLGTFNGFDSARTTFDRIDYVWLSPRNWDVLRYEVPHPVVNGRYASDHFPVVVGMRAR